MSGDHGSAVDVIRTKRDGGELSDEQIRWFLWGYTAGTVADEQAAALTMAIFWRGLTPRELSTWTRAMIESGEMLDLSGLDRPTVDKHSTGGVGDKVSLVLCPLVAACGAAVPQLSGRGLGHTGGTLDKMEAITGWQASLDNDAIVRQLREVGAVICAAGAGLAPADRKLYSLRDVTATVESIPLIASSIMSKKIAEGTSALVLDVKFGSGAFLVDPDRSRELARTMVALGRDHGVATAALLTAMDSPLGRTAGNALEVQEAIDCLAGGGPADLVELAVTLAREMLTLAGLHAAPDPAEMLARGAAMDTWRQMVTAQGGDPTAPLPAATQREVLRADRDGFLTRLDARAVGVAAWRLGAGRARKEDPVSATAGVTCLVKPGEAVRAGQPILQLHLDDASRLAGALAALEGAWNIGSPQEAAAAASAPLILDRIG